MEIVWIVWLADVFHSFIRRPFFHRKTSLDSGLYVTNHGFEDTVAAAVPDEVAVATDTFNDIFSLQPLDHTCNANNWERTAYHVVRYMNANLHACAEERYLNLASYNGVVRDGISITSFFTRFITNFYTINWLRDGVYSYCIRGMFKCYTS